MYQFPALDNHIEFEKLVRDVCKKMFNEPCFELYGRGGQEQNGIDGYHLINDKVVAFQCKEKYVNKKEQKLVDILKEEMREEAIKTKDFFAGKHSVDRYIFATTFKNDINLQNTATELSEELGFKVEYWGWETITGYFEDSIEIVKEYYPQWFANLQINAEKYVKFIDTNAINKVITNDSQSLVDLSIKYYKVNDDDDVVFKVVCNNIDIPNAGALRKAKDIIDTQTENAAIWITGEGGTGKTTLLVRLAVGYAKTGKKVFCINFEDISFSSQKVDQLLGYIRYKSENEKAYIFIDNPDFKRECIEVLLGNIAKYSLNFIIVFAERGNRLEAIKRDNIQHLVSSQQVPEPVKVYPGKGQRESVYKKLYELIGEGRDDVKDIIKATGIDSNQSFVEATYKILYALQEYNYIKYTYDWVEYENLAKVKFPSLANSYKYTINEQKC